MYKLHQKICKRVGLLICIITTCLLAGCASHRQNPQAVEGSLNLAGWKFVESGPVILSGQWSFDWGELKGPSSSPKSSTFVDLPSLWSDSGLPAMGHVTYHLKVYLPVNSPSLSLLVKGPLSVIKIYVNGVEVAASGIVGTSIESEFPERHLVFPAFVPDADVLDVTLQVSNYHNVQGGLKIPILLGTTEQIELLVKRNWIIGSVLGGSLIVMGVCHLILFAIMRRKRANLFFGIFCLLWATTTLAGETWYFSLANIFPSLPWSTSIYLALAPYAFSIPLIVMFYHALFPKKYAFGIELFYWLMSVVYLLYLSLTPANAFGFGVLLYCIVVTSLFPYLFFQLLRDLWNREKDAIFLIPGYAFLGLTGTLDRLGNLNFLDIDFLIPYGSYGFIGSYSILIVFRFAQSYRTVDRLAQDLEQTKKRLEEEQKITLMSQVVKNDKQAIVNETNKKQLKRELAVKIMNLSLAHWYECTGVGKPELAIRTNIWKVYVDQNGWQRTQTLDKYLDILTIPQKPRYSLVIRTAGHVLEEGESSFKEELCSSLLDLKECS